MEEKYIEITRDNLDKYIVDLRTRSKDKIDIKKNKDKNGRITITDYIIPQKNSFLSHLSQFFCQNENNEDKQYLIKEIGESLFSDDSSVKQVDFKTKYLKIIGAKAFQNTSLKSIKFPESIEEIGNYAFANCPLQEIDFHVSAKLKKIGDFAFSGCHIQGELVIPKSVTEIGNYAFANCLLQGINFPIKLRKIGDFAFSGCHIQGELVIPKSVTEIGKNAFKGVPFLRYDGKAIGAPWGAKNFRSKAMEEEEQARRNVVEESIRENDKSRERLAKALEDNHNINIKTVRQFKEKGKKAEEEAKRKAEEEAKRKAEDEAKRKAEEEAKRKAEEEAKRKAEEKARRKIEEEVRRKKSNQKPLNRILDNESIFHLSNTKMPDGKTCLDSRNFKEATTLFIPASYEDDKGRKYRINEIEERFFKNWDKLESVTFAENSVEIIGAGAFKDCKSLKTIKIYDGVKDIGEEAFKNCESLENITLSTNSLKEIRDSVFENCKNLKIVTIPSNVKSIKAKAFMNCSSLKKLDIEEGVIEIGESAFASCDELQEVNIPKSVVKIGDNAFLGIPYLEELLNDNIVNSNGEQIIIL